MMPSQLARHLDWMASGKVNVLSLQDLMKDHSDADAIAVTFDDGLSNFGEIAAPLLSERNLTATIFVAPGHAGGTNSWDSGNSAIPKLSMMSWDEIRLLSQQGFDIGGHGNTHISLRGLAHDKLRDEVETTSRSIADRIGKKPASFAYPYGDFDDRCVKAVAELFELACTAELRTLRPGDDRHALPRLDMYYFRDVSVGQMWGTRKFDAYVKLRAAGRKARTAMRRLL